MLQNSLVGCRILLGLVFCVFGLNGFLELFPMQEGLSPKALSFMVMMKNCYLFSLVKGIEVVAGVLLGLNQFVPLAVVLLAPIVLNIFLFHFFLQPSELFIAVAVLFLEIVVAFCHLSSFKSLFTRASVK